MLEICPLGRDTIEYSTIETHIHTCHPIHLEPGGRSGSDIDTGFGLTSASGHDVVASMIVFADDGQNEGLEQGEEIQMEAREIRSAGDDA